MEEVMEKKKYIRKDITDFVFKNLKDSKIKKPHIDKMICLVLDFIRGAMEEGSVVELRWFGTFYVNVLKPTIKTIPASKLKHPKKNYVEVQVNERKAVKFKQSKYFKIYLNLEEDDSPT
jgi:nucleoid DNA-binding protein